MLNISRYREQSEKCRRNLMFLQFRSIVPPKTATHRKVGPPLPFSLCNAGLHWHQLVTGGQMWRSAYVVIGYRSLSHRISFAFLLTWCGRVLEGWSCHIRARVAHITKRYTIYVQVQTQILGSIVFFPDYVRTSRWRMLTATRKWFNWGFQFRD